MASRETMTISLPQNMRAWVEELVAKAGYGTASEYFRELVRQDRDRRQRQGERDKISRELLAILDEDRQQQLTPEVWGEIRGEVRRRLEKKNGRGKA